MTDTTAVATIDNELDDATAATSFSDVSGTIAAFNTTDATKFYSSIQTENFEDRITVFNAVQGSNPLADNIGKVINLKDFIVQSVTLPDDKTGEVNEAPRCTLIDADGTAYHATSVGIMGVLLQLYKIAGEPSGWAHPIAVQAVREKGNNGYNFFTLRPVAAKK